ncbi:MAG: phytanoyl-CoA dioxygenase family protein [Pseudomonadales bacterium]|nr:phytanoyl-CoA dioxygenase family protein [Pseudomonadales bacterium]MCP5184330.1 phytanoyl-CoA dioxygenase family protein [Pseudomonadales bacterium]
MTNIPLRTLHMARFTARGFLRMDAVVPPALNARFLADVGHPPDDAVDNLWQHYGRIMQTSAIPLVIPGTPLADAYPEGSAVAELLALPAVRGAINSLVGEGCVVDHHFLHITFPGRLHASAGLPHNAQVNHQDSTIDPRQAFDVQIMYFPHDVTLEMGGTRFIPGTHLRVVSEAAIARYQNVRGQQHMVCKAGTLLFLHHGIWHGGGRNDSERLRYMFKIRLCPTAPQSRLWDTSDLDALSQPRPIFWTGGKGNQETIESVLMQPEPWFEADTGRLEYINRIRLWRYLSGNPGYDADYWLTRVENEQAG